MHQYIPASPVTDSGSHHRAVVILSPTPTAVPFPNALALNEYATFGSADMIGKATVYGYDMKPGYNWTSPSWNSPGEQGAASQPLEIQRGYTMEKPQEGNTFLFVYVRVLNTGKKCRVCSLGKTVCGE